MKKGDVVMIYNCPISKKHPEGEAELVRLETKMGPVLEMWIVNFKKWHGPTGVSRLIRVDRE